ncbi:MAG: SpoIVB peptidase S55, partial [Candidatus Latescibacteria bacterium]|nr:SpoIVB peptidase S55 [Candidatus Latescibacterota bacterium]
MIKRIFIYIFAISVLKLVSPVSAQPYMPVEEIQVGMVGIGKTVFQGTQIDTFEAEVLGVLRNVFGPKSDMILARLSGGPLAETGVIAGMSGSPVYIDGKLIGAV